jgi:NitT/TauT family transport system substrate-binding protein
MIPEAWTRRGLLRSLGALGLTGAVSALRAAEPPPETKRIRLIRYPPFDVACLSPMWMAEELLRAEGFDDVR